MTLAVDIQGISKKFRRSSNTTIKSYLLHEMWRGKRNEDSVIWALKDVNLAVKKGATLGIIGQNGSGKSTLLKIIAGIIRPDAGDVSVNGKISALIELGAGFHPLFTGRENIYINGMLLGLTKKEITKKIDGIIEFAGLGDFIDQPVRTYSSGMYSKLGFSVAVNVDPDILLIDEVFAVGDEEFVHKCKVKMDEFKRRGKTILFVTHALATVEQWCDEAMWLRYGVVKAAGKSDALGAYRQEIFDKENINLIKQNENALNDLGDGDGADAAEEAGEDKEAPPEDAVRTRKRWGSRDVEITSVKIIDSTGAERYGYHTGEKLTIRAGFRADKPVANPVFGFAVLTTDGLWCYGTNTYVEKIDISGIDGEGALEISIENVDLLSGQYYINVAVSSVDGFIYDYHNQIYQISVTSDRNDVGLFRLGHKWGFSGSLLLEDKKQEAG